MIPFQNIYSRTRRISSKFREVSVNPYGPPLILYGGFETVIVDGVKYIKSQETTFKLRVQRDRFKPSDDICVLRETLFFKNPVERDIYYSEAKRISSGTLKILSLTGHKILTPHSRYKLLELIR